MKISIFPICLLILFMIFSNTLLGHDMSASDMELIVTGNFVEYILIGSEHMLSGYDHLLFIFGIVFFLKSFKDIIKYITVFTIGHSITLIYATFNNLVVNYLLIDAIIALSVCFVAFINFIELGKKIKISRELILSFIFIFGLIHGLGLSARLQQLPLNKDSLLINILSFNLGIEIGQILALILMLTLISFFHNSSFFRPFSIFSNIFLSVFGIYTFSILLNEYKETKFLVSQKKQLNYKEKIKIIIPANTGKEYKLWIQKDVKLEYSWKTNEDKIYYDFHGEPAGDTTGYFKSYKEGKNNFVSGSVVTPFLATHGWYWKNETSKQISIVLEIKGDYKRMDL